MATKTPRSKAPSRSAVVPISSKVKAKAAPVNPEMTLRPTLDGSDAPFYYSNFMEVTRSINDFSIFSARLPAKLSAAQREGASKTGMLEMPADLQISFSPRVAVGLVKALTKQIEDYEKAHGPITKEKPND
jgi:hypothetical protein